jgi:hypothetical protein
MTDGGALCINSSGGPTRASVPEGAVPQTTPASVETRCSL